MSEFPELDKLTREIEQGKPHGIVANITLLFTLTFAIIGFIILFIVAWKYVWESTT
jgi:hypothetical protein